MFTQAAALARVAAEASRRHGAGRLWAARRARGLRVAAGFEYEEALVAGLLDPSVPAAEAARHVSEYHTTALVDRLNPQGLAAVTAEKLIFYRLFTALGLPVPTLFGVVGAAGGWSAASGRPLADARSVAAFLRHETPDEFVIKPSAGHHGLGVRVLRREGDALVDLGGRRLAVAALAAEILSDREFDLWVVQQRLHNHPDVLALCASETLQTARVTTFVPGDGEVQVVHAGFKLGTGGGNIDNFRGGTTGNLLAEVNVATGALRCPFGGAAELPGAEGRTLPDWHEACALVRRASRVLLPQRTMGWDVGFTPEGPRLVEANRGYDPFPSPGFGDVMRAVQHAVAEGREARLEVAG